MGSFSESPPLQRDRGGSRGNGESNGSGGPGADPLSPADAAAVRAQLDLILASSEFRLGKRYPAFLKFIVEEALAGRADQLKERAIGVTVFEREPDYDTSVDHVVRSAAAEIRKRLAQYYQEDAHKSELRIEVPSGAYAPQFRPAPLPGLATAAVAEPEWLRRLRKWAAPFAAFAGGVALTLTSVLLLSSHPKTALDRFWDPVVARQEPVTICIADDPRLLRDANTPTGDASSAPALAPSIGDIRALTHQVAHMEDAVALTRLAAQVHAKGREFRVLTASASAFNDFKEGPSVLIGGVNNRWSQRVMEGLRFRVSRSPTASGMPPAILDSQDSTKSWSPVPTSTGGSITTGYGAVARDYALAVRCRDPQTNQMVVIAAGLLGFGTLASGEFLSSPELMQKLASRAPAGWESRNIEVVLSTEVVQGVPSHPEIVTLHVW